MKLILVLAITVAIPFARPQSSDVRFREAQQKETVQGDLRGAIQIYQEIADAKTSSRALAAQALRTPVIFLSARAHVVDRIQGLDLGANDYVVKPFSPGELMARVRRHLQREQETRDDHRHLEDEIRAASAVQQRLFPQFQPPVPNFDYAAVCRPAKEVSGDYYDFITPPGDSLAFTQGDVCGKGIAAAMLMASLQSLLRSELARAPASLASLMNKFNDAVSRSVLPEGYSTLFCGQIDKQRKRLTYVNAGHVRPMLLRASGLLERLDVGGTPVGLFKAARYEEGRRHEDCTPPVRTEIEVREQATDHERRDHVPNATALLHDRPGA